MHKLKLPAAFVLLLLLSACQTLGVQAPQTFNQHAAAATASVNTASQTTLTLLQAHKISPDEADQFTDRAEDAQKAINAAVAVHSQDPDQAERRLDLVIQALTILTAELEALK